MSCHTTFLSYSDINSLIPLDVKFLFLSDIFKFHLFALRQKYICIFFYHILSKSNSKETEARKLKEIKALYL